MCRHVKVLNFGMQQQSKTMIKIQKKKKKNHEKSLPNRVLNPGPLAWEANTLPLHYTSLHETTGLE